MPTPPPGPRWLAGAALAAIVGGAVVLGRPTDDAPALVAVAGTGPFPVPVAVTPGDAPYVEVVAVPAVGRLFVGAATVTPGQRLPTGALRVLRLDPAVEDDVAVGALTLAYGDAVHTTWMQVWVHPCDGLAAGTSDPAAIGTGVPLAAIEPEAAEPACRDALGRFPGHPRFAYQLGRVLARLDRHAEALRWYRVAAEQGYVAAQYNLANLYRRGDGAPQDEAQAVHWYRLAAEGGFAKAQNNLGWAHDHGRGAASDDAMAARWYRLAAEQGLPHAQMNLARLYFLGAGVPQDDGEAVRWYGRAAEQGDVAARRQLDALSALARVRGAQKLLLEAGYDPGPADGFMGPRTGGAIVAFQRDLAMQLVDGVVSTDLLIALAAYAD